ncbi:MAG: UxaA family hydrolase [Lachnospiraceae bacterium]|nr:UxaA family hydrolase [Lachnospiraceae bacterium]
MKRAMIIHREDSVAVAADSVLCGEEVYYEAEGHRTVLIAATDIPVYHKLAVREIHKGERVIKYGCTIGIALEEIPAGAHVHIHNMRSEGAGNG